MSHIQALARLHGNCAALDLLVVEDNAGACRIVVELLRGAGFSGIAVAHSAEAAIDQMQNVRPHLLLLDWNLPGMSGLDLVRAIRRSADVPDPRFADPQVPVVMITGRHQAGDVAAARDAGVSDFVVKPYSTASILRALNRAMTRTFIPEAAPEPAAEPVPERARRKASLFPGLLRSGETADPVAALRRDLVALRARLRASGPTRQALDDLPARLDDAARQFDTSNSVFFESATHSLNDYVQCFGVEADPEVLDVHLDVLVRLCDVADSHQEDALSLVTHLQTLVARRRGRKVAP